MDNNAATINQHGCIAPAQLWIGKEEQLITLVNQYLKSNLCPHHSCGTCITCIKIQSRQHHDVIWLAPEKQYTIESLEIIAKTVVFHRAAHNPLFFILQKADFLRTTSANSLLKTIEEPPTGYHFILLAACIDDIIPTIKSRCLITVHQNLSVTSEYKDLFLFFTNANNYDPLAYAQVLEKSYIHEHDSRLLLDALLQHWSHEYQIAHKNANAQSLAIAYKIIQLIKKSSLRPPMSGSTQLFWKSFFLNFKSINHP